MSNNINWGKIYETTHFGKQYNVTGEGEEQVKTNNIFWGIISFIRGVFS